MWSVWCVGETGATDCKLSANKAGFFAVFWLLMRLKCDSLGGALCVLPRSLQERKAVEGKALKLSCQLTQLLQNDAMCKLMSNWNVVRTLTVLTKECGKSFVWVRD